MRTIGVTGGIGCGKSFVCRVLEAELGVPVYDCDAAAKRLMAASPQMRTELTELVGAPGKEALAAYLFASADNAARVNAIVHPHVRRDFQQWRASQSASIVAIESAILRQSHFDDMTDEVWVVVAPPHTRLERIVQRGGIDRQQALQRMAAQGEQWGEPRIDNGPQATRETITQQIKALLTC